MKLTTLSIVWVVITFTILLFNNIGEVEPTSGAVAMQNMTSLLGDPSQAKVQFTILGVTFTYSAYTIWETLLNPLDTTIGIVAFLIGLGTLIGLFVWASTVSQSYPPDSILMLGWLAITLTFGFYPIILVYGFLNSELTSLMCAGSSCLIASLIRTIVTSFMALVWIFTCISHWRTGGE